MTAAEAVADFIETPETSPLDVGDDAWVVYWRDFPMPGNQKNGTWETDPTKVISVGRNGTVCHEMTNQSSATSDAGRGESFIRWTPADRVFRTRAEAAAAARELPAPK